MESDDPSVSEHPAEIANTLRLQHRLKQEFTLKESEAVQKNRLRQMIDEQIRGYYASEVRNISQGQGRLLDDEGFGDCYNFVKEVLLLISKDPAFLVTVLENAPKESQLSISKLIQPIVNILYENLVEGDDFHKDITKIIIGIQEEELSGKKLSWLKQQIIETYLNRVEYRHYACLVVRNTLINICEEEPQYGIPHVQARGSSEYESLLLSFDIHRHVIEGLPSSQILGKLKFSHRGSLHSDRGRSSSVDSFEEAVDSERWLVLIMQEYIEDIFASVYRMPIGLKIICKSMELHMNRAEPPVPRESILSRVWKYIFHLFYENLQFNQKFLASQFATERRLASLDKVRTIFCRLHNIESQSDEIRRRVFKFVEEMLSLPEERLIRLRSNESVERLKSLAVCLSFEQTLILFELILNSPQAKDLNSRIYNRVSRISEMSEGFDFLKKVKPQKGVQLPEHAYTLFQELVLPSSLELDYQKLYHETYKDSKLKNILRQILVTLPPIEQYLIGCKVRNFTELLHRLELRYSTNEQEGTSDRIPTIVKIKYFLWLVKNESINNLCLEMISEYEGRIQDTLELYKNTKVEYLRALQSLKYYVDRAHNRQKLVKDRRLKEKARSLVDQIRFRYCVSSPRSRQKEFGTNGRLVIPNCQKIIVDGQESCIHTKGLEVHAPTNDKLHVTNVHEFVDAFCFLEEVRTAIAQGQDRVGINANIFWFLGVVTEIVGKEPTFTNHQQWLREYLEDLITRRIYQLIFPRRPTYKDLALYTRIRSLEWLTPNHLNILKRNSVQQVWQIAKRCVYDMEKGTCTNDKFNSIKEFLRIINGLLFINNDGGAMDNIYPMIVYSLVRAKPARFNSSLNFIELFTDPGKMLSSEGYCFTCVKSAVMYLENLTEKNLQGITAEEMQAKIYESELKMGIPFLRRNKSAGNFASMGQLRQKLDE